MKYILIPDIALRSWRLVPQTYYIRGMGAAQGLNTEEFDLMKKCDGETDLQPSPARRPTYIESI